ncbi:fibroblast growth factor receptor-like 1 isoform X2 [Lineus longissimus]
MKCDSLGRQLQGLWLSLLLMVCYYSPDLCWAYSPPRISQKIQPSIIGILGETIKIPCPVEADPKPYIEWSKDKLEIHEGWERFEKLKMALKITDLEMEDAGNYICVAANGFGSKTINYTLIILENLNDTATLLEHDLGDKSGVPPQFSHPTKMRKHIDTPEGSSVKLKCKARGKPRPEVMWYKDGHVLQGEISRGLATVTKWTILLRSLRRADSGRYTCKVFNRAGSINFTYTLNVIDKLKMKPTLLAPHPVNTTVKHGDTASFQCMMKSEVTPHIQWLKRVDNAYILKQMMNRTIEVSGQKFMVLKTGEVLAKKDGSYLNKLVIPNASEDDSGLYVCLGTNLMGFNYREAYLTVLPDPNIHMMDLSNYNQGLTEKSGSHISDPTHLTLIISLPIAAAVILIAIIIVIRQKCSTNTPTINHQRYAVPPMQDKDHFRTIPNHQSGLTSRDQIVKSYNPDLHSHSDISQLPRMYTQPQQHTMYGEC